MSKLADIRIADVADILLAAACLYVALRWLRDHASRGLAFVCGSLAVVFVLADYFDLYLTSMVFRFGLAIAAIVFVVVFQDDIRHAVEQAVLAARFRRKPSSARTQPHVSDLVDTVFSLAKQRRGALVVLSGLEPLDLHLEGGIELLGRISEPLLESLFDPNSQGHDGAVIIHDGFVRRFAVHLPFSNEHSKLKSVGTRHRAALGLAERTDSLVIVVSEERGEVSLAKDGELRRRVDQPTLEAALQSHLETPVRSRRSAWPMLSFVFRHPRTKLTALALATVAWFLVAPEEPGSVSRVFLVPIEYRNVPPTASTTLTDVRVTLSGPERAFNSLPTNSLKVVVNLKDVTIPASLPLTPSNVKHPPSLRTDRVEPSEVWIQSASPSAVEPQPGKSGA